jgi:hypothetical protein
MENKDEKLIRSRNFTPSKINILVQLVEKRRQILECKKTGVITTKKKMQPGKSSPKNSIHLAVFLDPLKCCAISGPTLKKLRCETIQPIKNIREVLVEGQAKKKLETTADAVVMDILGERLTGMVSEYDSDQQQYAGITT